MTSSLVSIITPVRNGLPHIRECIESIAAQDAGHEHIVSDGASTDGTREYLKAVPGLRLLEGPDKGQGDGLAKGFAAATGDILGWVNADDCLLPGALTRIRDALDRHPDAVAVAGDGRQLDLSGAVIGGIQGMPADPRSILFRDSFLQPSTWFRRAAFEKTGGLNPELSYCMDTDLWRRLLAIGAVARISEVWSDYRLHPRSKTFRTPSAFVGEWRDLLEMSPGPATGQAYDVERCGSDWVLAATLEDETLMEKLAGETDAATASWIRGLLYLRAGRNEDADADLRRAASSGTSAVRLHALRDRLRLAVTRGDASVAAEIADDVDRILRALPHVEHPEREGVWARYALASLHESLGRFEEATAGFEAIIRIEPTDRIRHLAGAWFHLGSVRAATGRHHEAAEAFRICVTIVPGHRAAAAGLGAACS